MKNLYHSLLLLIAGSTQKQLASQIRYLKIENQILRSKLPFRVSVTEQEKVVSLQSLPVSILHRLRECLRRPRDMPRADARLAEAACRPSAGRGLEALQRANTIMQTPS
jgi:hypothetical protein